MMPDRDPRYAEDPVIGLGRYASAQAPEPDRPPRQPGQTRPMHARPGSGRHSHAKRPNRSLVRELPILVLVALVIAIVIKTFIVQAFVIPTGSMQDTLELQDKILVNKLVYHFRPIHAGDIVVFDGAGSWNAPATGSGTSTGLVARAYDDTLRKLFDSVGGLFGTPIGQTDYVKRVIGVPGDHVACCNGHGQVTVNGVPLNELSYLYPGDRSNSHPFGIPAHFNVTVPKGYLWVLGDHRGISDDSRGHEADPGNGMIPEAEVIGRAFVIVWPPSQWRILPIPSTFEQPGIAATAAAAGVSPAAAYVPVAAGFGAAVPLTWIRRRALIRRGRRRPGSGSGGGPGGSRDLP